MIKPVQAADIVDRHTITMSVSKFSTVNCDSSYSAIIEDMLSAALHSSGTFTMVDAVQKERTAEKNKPENKIKTAAGIEKTITGTVTKNSDLIITIMSVDTQSAEIDLIITERIGTNTNLKNAVDKISGKIRNFYLVRRELNRKSEISVKASSFIPAGKYSKYLHPSYGGLATFSENSIAGENVSMFVSSGINKFLTKQDRYRSFAQLYAAGGPSGRFRPFNSMTLSPRIGVGSVWTRMEYDTDGMRNAQGFRYENKFFQNYCFLFETEISIHLKDRWMFSLSGGFMHILDSSNSGSLFFTGAGIKSLF